MLSAAEATIKTVLLFPKPYTFKELETRAKQQFGDAAGCVRHPHAALLKMKLVRAVDQHATPPPSNGLTPLPTTVYENDAAWMRGEYGDAVKFGLDAVTQYNVERRASREQAVRVAFSAIPVEFRDRYPALARVVARIGAQRYSKVSRLVRKKVMCANAVIAACEQLCVAGLVKRLPLKTNDKRVDTVYARAASWTEARAAEVLSSRLYCGGATEEKKATYTLPVEPTDKSPLRSVDQAIRDEQDRAARLDAMQRERDRAALLSAYEELKKQNDERERRLLG